MTSREFNHLKRHKIYVGRDIHNSVAIVHPKDWMHTIKMRKKTSLDWLVWQTEQNKRRVKHFHPDMKIYIDTPFNGWSHLVANTVDNLHIFAKEIGLDRSSFVDGADGPFYDCMGDMIQHAINAGAVRVTRQKLADFLKKNYAPELL